MWCYGYIHTNKESMLQAFLHTGLKQGLCISVFWPMQRSRAQAISTLGCFQTSCCIPVPVALINQVTASPVYHSPVLHVAGEGRGHIRFPPTQDPAPGKGQLTLQGITQGHHRTCLFVSPHFRQVCFIPEGGSIPPKPPPCPQTHHLILHQSKWHPSGLGSCVLLALHVYCTLLRSRVEREGFGVRICSGYCLCRSDWMREQWVSFQFLMSTSNYLFNFMPGEALYSYTQNHFTSFVMLCFRGDWLAFQLTALITTWIWLHCWGINITQQSI